MGVPLTYAYSIPGLWLWLFIVVILSILASFHDQGTLDGHTATINWGDGTPATAGTLTINVASGLFDIHGSHTYAASGTYPIAITATTTAKATIIAAAAPADPESGWVGWSRPAAVPR